MLIFLHPQIILPYLLILTISDEKHNYEISEEFSVEENVASFFKVEDKQNKKPAWSRQQAEYGWLLTDYTTLYPRRQNTSYLQL